MNAIKIGHKNILESSTVTVTNEDTDYPKYRLFDRRMGRLFKGTGTADHTIHAEDTTLLQAIEVSGSGTTAIAGSLFAPVDCGGLTKANGALIIDLKCSDWSEQSGNSYIEITSAGTADTEEWAIDTTGLSITGTYKTFNLPLSAAITSGGELVVNQIDFVRFVSVFLTSQTIYWKNAKIYIDDGVNGLYIPVGHNLKNTTLTLSSSEDDTNWNTVATASPTSAAAILEEFTETYSPFWKLVLTGLTAPPELPELFLTKQYEFICRPLIGLKTGLQQNIQRTEPRSGAVSFLKKGPARQSLAYRLKNITPAEKTAMEQWIDDWDGCKPFLFTDHHNNVFFAELLNNLIFEEYYNRYEADINILEYLG